MNKLKFLKSPAESPELSHTLFTLKDIYAVNYGLSSFSDWSENFEIGIILLFRVATRNWFLGIPSQLLFESLVKGRFDSIIIDLGRQGPGKELCWLGRRCKVFPESHSSTIALLTTFGFN